MVVYAAVTQKDVNGQPAKPSNLTAIYIPAGVTGQQINLSVTGATDSMLIGWDVWAGLDRRRIAWQFNGSGAPPATISIPGPIVDLTIGLPETAAWGIKIAAKHVWHAGIAGLLVNSVTAPNQIQSNDFKGSTDNWVGQLITIVSNVSGDVPLWNFQVTAFNATTGTLTVTPDCVNPGDATLSVQAGDVMIVYSRPTSATATTITNSMWNNSVNRQQFPGSAGMDPGAEVGRIIRILRGKGAGQWRVCTVNDNVTHTIDPPWDVIPDSTSIYIVEAPDWPSFSTTSQILAPGPGISVSPHMEAPNLADEVALVAGFLIDDDGQVTDDEVAVYRLIYLFGQPPTVRTVGPDAGPFDVQVTDQTIVVDSSANDVTLTLPPLDVYQGRNLLIFNQGTYSTIINTTPPDTFPDGSQQQIISAAGGTMRITAGGLYTT
jgi:hypothetical protein